MNRIILDKLNDIVFKNNCDLDIFLGTTVTKHKDIKGVEYELKENEDKYYRLGTFEDSSVFISENRLLHTLLNEYIHEIESGRIYEHGYPESRLIPSNHHESCQEEYKEYILSEISKKTTIILDEYF